MSPNMLSKAEAELLLNIIEAESIKLDSLKSKKEYELLDKPRKVLESARKKIQKATANI